MPATTKTKRRSEKSTPKFPIVCKTWDEVDEIKRKYLKPVDYGPKGQEIYDYEELMKLVILPNPVERK